MRLLNTKQAAEILSSTPQKVRDLVHKGHLPVYYITQGGYGLHMRVLEADLHEYITSIRTVRKQY